MEENLQPGRIKQPLLQDASGMSKQRSGRLKVFLRRSQGIPGGSVPDPGYEQVESGTTGHAEAVGIVFDPSVVSYDQLLDVFWDMHDPAQVGGQGEYTGSQYRSVIFYHDEKQKTAAITSRDRLAASEKYRNRPILTEILPASEFWPAEECHQRFYEKCGQGYCTSRKIWE